MSKITISTTTVDAQEFWASVNGSAWETWDWWKSYTYSEGADWNKLGSITVVVEDPESEHEWTGVPQTITKTLNVHDLAKAFGELLAENRSFDWEDLDACDGDEVFQQAVFGEVIYG
jgi:hypothetical protein